MVDLSEYRLAFPEKKQAVPDCGERPHLDNVPL